MSCSSDVRCMVEYHIPCTVFVGQMGRVVSLSVCVHVCCQQLEATLVAMVFFAPQGEAVVDYAGVLI